MTDLQCPVPAIGEALSPWVHSRLETQRIRQQISQYLSTLSHGGQGYDPLLECAAPSINLGAEPGTIDGLHKRYYEALRANVTARENYQRVKQELQDLRSTAILEQSSSSQENKRQALDKYIRSQRQRRQHVRLNVIQDTLSQLTDHAPRSLHDDLGALVREATGEAPDIPKVALGAAENDEEVKELLFHLKRSLLLSKQATERASLPDHNEHTNGNGHLQPSTAAQVYALRLARSQLISWIEGELSKISDGEGDSSMIETDEASAANASQPELPTEEHMLQGIQSMYEGYVTARRNLIRDIDTATTATAQRVTATMRTPQKQGAAASVGDRPPPSDAITYADLMTAIPTFIQTSLNERVLIQQASYLRRQLNTASEETTANVQRLAGESYLVPTDASSTTAWATAAVAKHRETETFVRDKLASGRTAIDATAARLAEVETKTNALAELGGDFAV